MMIQSEIEKFQKYISGVIWLTGLPASGKTTVAKALKDEFLKRNKKVEHLDGDEIRSITGFNGFSKNERLEHIKRVGYTAHLLERNNIWVIVSLVSPYEEARNFCKTLCINFYEIYISTPIEVCKERDFKKLYEKALAGKILNMTGIQDSYEVPKNPFLNFNLNSISAKNAADQIIRKVDVQSSSKILIQYERDKFNDNFITCTVINNEYREKFEDIKILVESRVSGSLITQNSTKVQLACVGSLYRYDNNRKGIIY